MDVRTIGLHKIYVAPITDLSSTVMPDNNTANDTHWVDLGDVYENTAKLTDDDPEVTTHKSETSAKKITLSNPGDCKLELSLMDPTLEELQRLFGGTISTVTVDGENAVCLCNIGGDVKIYRFSVVLKFRGIADTCRKRTAVMNQLFDIWTLSDRLNML